MTSDCQGNVTGTRPGESEFVLPAQKHVRCLCPKTETVHDGDLFYVYNPHLLVSHPVRGAIAWVGAEDRDRRRRLRYLRFPITTDEATHSLLGEALGKMHVRLHAAKNPSPFRGLQFVPEGYVHPRFFYCPGTAQVLVLLAANALAISKEVKATGLAWKAGDLEQALQPWLEQNDD